MAKPIDKKYLAGLTFSGANVEDSEEDGKTVKRSVPFRRDLEQGDVLDWLDNGDSIIIVTADGRKHTVSKKAEKAKE